MGKLYLFNPENDMALAYGKANYSAPKNALAIAEAGAWLPAWLAAPCDYVLAPEVDSEWFTNVGMKFGLICSNFSDVTSGDIDSISPWGWSADAKSRISKAGISKTLLPDDTVIEKIRWLSHRRTAIDINRMMGTNGFETPELSVEVNDATMLPEVIERRGRCMVKAPWSSSGRGILDSGLLDIRTLVRLSDGIIGHQGSVTVEKYLDKVMDFAMLFKINGGIARFCGFSIFNNNRSTSYSGNIIAPQTTLRTVLTSYISGDILDRIASTLEMILSELAGGFYEGDCGIDQMIYKDGNSVKIAPCIEINLRTTMGFVALALADRYLAPGSSGVLRILYNTRCELQKAKVVNHRLKEGGIDLVSPSHGFRFIFDVTRQIPKGVCEVSR